MNVPWKLSNLSRRAGSSFSPEGREGLRTAARKHPTLSVIFGLTICLLEAQTATLPGPPREAICAGHRMGATHRRGLSQSQKDSLTKVGAHSGLAVRLGGQREARLVFSGKKLHGENIVSNISSKNAVSGLITKVRFSQAGSFGMHVCGPRLPVTVLPFSMRGVYLNSHCLYGPWK